MLVASIGCEKPQVISFIGGGGKTSTIRALARELQARQEAVMVTTTTRLGLAEALIYDRRLLLADSPGKKPFSEFELPQKSLFLVGSVIAGGKWVGISPEQVDTFHGLIPHHYILVEADGAAKKPFKAPACHEPVIPLSTDLVIGVMGAWVIDQVFHGDMVHRLAEMEEITGLSPGDILTVEAIAQVILHGAGYQKAIPPQAQFIMLLNGVNEENRAKAEKLAYLLQAGGIAKVLLANIREENSVVEVYR